ncbi:hypothetical protein Btru_061703 [Bulinus truncatus]|nr:hypothetical protein Btru_061703 [Bulinus truncatus]
MAELNKEIECRRLRELFRGRFLQEEAEKLITHFKGLTDASNFVMQSEPETVGKFLNRSSESYIELSREESESLNEKLTNGLELFSEERLFACQTCERCWWKKVPSRKQVSTCYKCKERYDPIPRDKEWGNGQFRCGHCGHEFNTPATMGMTISLCHRCNYPVEPYKVLPPRRKKETSESRYSRGWYSWGWGSHGFPDKHNCNGINCHNCNHQARPPTE